MGKFSKCDYCGEYEEHKWGDYIDDSFVCNNCFSAYQLGDVPNPVLPSQGEQISLGQAIEEGIFSQETLDLFMANPSKVKGVARRLRGGSKQS